MWELSRVVGGWASPPPTLYLRGQLPGGAAVAVVGTREATAEACAFAVEVCAALVAAGVAIWSGGARGIDAVAHRAALEHGGRTVVVAANGLDTAYPPEHASLFQQVLSAGGALLSMQPDGMGCRRHYFIQRNALLAAFTCATVLVQAPFKSGARSTCAAARRLGRPLLVVPQAPWSPQGGGCAKELARGAFALESAKQACRIVRAVVAGKPLQQQALVAAEQATTTQLSLPRVAVGRSRPRDPAGIDDWPGSRRAVWHRLSLEPMHLDALCGATGLAARVVSGALLELRLVGLALEVAPGRYRRA